MTRKTSVDFVAFTNDGQTLISKYSNGTKRTWEIKTLSLINSTSNKSFPHENQFHDQTNADYIMPHAISPDGNLIALGNSRLLSSAINLYKADSGELIHSLHISNKDHLYEEVISVFFSCDSKMIAVGHLGFLASLWDTETGMLIGIIKTRADSVCAIAFSPDSKTLAIGTNYYSAVQLLAQRH